MTLDFYERRLAEVTIGAPERLRAPIELCDYDPAWPGAFEREAERLRGALAERALRVEHVGSTSVPGLAAKPVIDIVLEVDDSAAEPAYRPDLEAAGYVLRIRESDWFEHRLFKDGAATVNLHVFSDACPETERMVALRDWLRGHAADRDLYAERKRALAARDWTYMQQYADAKTDVIDAIMARAQAGRSTHPRPAPD